MVYRHLFTLTLLVTGLIPGLAASASLDDYITERWYWTEVIIFQRMTVQEFNSSEYLASSSAPRYSAKLHAFRHPAGQGTAAGDSADYQLNPDTRAMISDTNFEIRQPTANSDRSLESIESDTATGLQVDSVSESRLRAQLRDEARKFENQLFESSFEWQDNPTGLSAEAGQLRRAQGYRVLMHGRWLQPIPPRKQAAPLLIRAGRMLSSGPQLEGSLAMTVGRYLHFQVQLWYQEPNLGQPLLDIPLLPGAALPVNLPFSLNRAPAYMRMDEHRRMRSQETHYLDHPKLGIIVRAEPVAPPASLVSLLEQIEKLQQ